jgi:RNA polymerase sigma-70 factor (ECF subfamily)
MTEAVRSDEQLLAEARGGNVRALEDLLERHQAQIYRFGMKMCRHPEDARDVLQDTLLTMSRGVRDFRGASSLSTWLYSIARSHCLKKRRRSQFAPAEERSLDTDVAAEAGRLTDPGAAPDEAVSGKQVEEVMDAAISALEPMYREVLLLRDVEGLTAPEVAEVVGVSVQAVKSRLHRARLAVRQRVAPLLGLKLDLPAAGPGPCPDVLALLSQHLEDEISAEVCADMERHLTVCSRCENACQSLKRTLSLCRTSAQSAEVPPAVQADVKAALRNYLAEKS